MADLRDYQVSALDNVRQAVREGCKRMVLQMPTGAGKTRLAADIVNGAQAKKKRVIFAVPAISLIDQTVEMFYAEGITDVGVIQANHWMTDWSKPIQIASIQTLQKREPPMADVVIRDECHVLFKFDVDWMLKRPEWRDKPFIGLSATPWTRGLGKIYERLIVGETTKGLIDRGVLSSFRVFAPSHPDLKGVRIRAGDYVEADLEQVMSRDKLVGDIVQTWLDKAAGRPTICFCVNRAHAKMMTERFEKAGVPAAYMDCMTLMPERLRIRNEFKAGRVKVVCNVDIIGIGVDWPSIACISYCRPTRSEMKFCLDAQTEVLTSRGWRGIGGVSEGDCVATMRDMKNGDGQWSRVLGVVERDMTPDETWIEYHGPQSDFRVTNRHRMIFAERPTFRRKGFIDAPYKIAEAERMLDCRESKRMPTAVTMNQPGVPLSDAELYFIGMMMTDGTWRERSASISQSERYPEIIDRIERCLVDCGIAYSKRRIPTPSALNSGVFIERHARWQYSLSFGVPREELAKPRRGQHLIAIKHGYERVPGPRGYAHLQPFLDKDLAPALMAISRAQFLVLLQGIHDGDGHKMKSPSVDWVPRSWTLCSARKTFVDRLQALAVVNGFGSHLHPEPRGKNSPLYVLTVTPKNWRSVGGHGQRTQIEQRPSTSERVWCVETETGTIVTRRRGKVTVVGNCQNIGRGLRKAAGKDDLLVLDHSDTHLRLGFVTDIGHDKLSDGKPSPEAIRAVPLPKACARCGYLKAPRVSECPSCGFAMPVPTCSIESKPGALEEFTGKKRAKAEQFTAEQKTRFFAELLAYAASKGYREGWAANKFREKFKVWPRGVVRDVEPANSVSAVTLSWIKRGQIAWAKSKNNPGNGSNGVGRRELEGGGAGVAGSAPVDVHPQDGIGGGGVL